MIHGLSLCENGFLNILLFGKSTGFLRKSNTTSDVLPKSGHYDKQEIITLSQLLSPSPFPHAPLPPEPDLDREPRGVKVLFAAIFCFSVTCLLSLNLAPSLMELISDKAQPQAETSDNMQWSIEAKVFIGQRQVERKASVAPGLSVVAERLERALNSKPSDMRRALIVAGHLDLDGTAQRLIQRLESFDRTERQRDFDTRIKALYLSDMPEMPPKEFLESLKEDIGWMAEIVKTDALFLSGAKEGEAARDLLHRACYRAYLTNVVATLSGLGMSILGLILLAIALSSLRRGRLRIYGAMVPVRPWLGFETFSLYLFYLIIAMAVVSLFRDGSERQMDAVSLAVMLAALLLVTWPVLRGLQFAQVSALAGLHRGQGFIREIGCGLVGFVAFVPLIALALLAQGMLMQHLGYAPSSASHPFGPELAGTTSMVQKLVLLVMAVVAAPLVEEIFFRGFFFVWLRGHVGVFFTALLSGLLFASFHPQGIMGIPVLLMIGFSLAMLRQWRGSLIAPIVAHALINGISSLILLLVQ